MFTSCRDCNGSGIIRITDDNHNSHTVACSYCGGDGVVYAPEQVFEVYDI